jgi:outer membrane protein assembly factor BamB
MKTSDLVFIGIKGSVIALHGAGGEQVWATQLATQLKGRGFVNVVLEQEAVLACCDGEIFCLDPLNGNVRWQNPLKGFGTGLATIATESSPGGGLAPLLAEERRHEGDGAASVSATV